MRIAIRPRALATCAIPLIALSIVATACGTTTEGTGAGDSDADTSQAQASLDAWYEGTFLHPPSNAPTPKPGKSIWVITLGQVLPASVRFSEAAERAESALDWNIKIFDGKLSPQNYVNGVEQAVASGADGIVLFGIDCSVVETPLRSAKNAGVMIVAAEGVDNCSEPTFDETVDYVEGDVMEWGAAIGAMQAAQVAVGIGGEGKVLEFWQSDVAILVAQHERFTSTLAELCPACENVPVEVTSADLAGGELQRKTEQALVQHPDARGVVVTYDDLITAGISAAVQASGRDSDLYVVGFYGWEDNVEMIQEGRGQDASGGSSPAWEAYHALDTLNRLFQGVPAASSGLGMQAFDPEHNMPASGDFVPPIDFAKEYEAAWTNGAE